jgi:hypothetical protein
MNITTDNIKEITERLDCGFCVFNHKTTEELLFVPDENNLTDIDLEPWEEELELLDNNFTDYYKIEKWSSNDAFDIMSEFAEQITNEKLQSCLFKALRKNKPFRKFKFVIDNSDNFRQKWFDFKAKKQHDFVERQIKRLQLKK